MKKTMLERLIPLTLSVSLALGASSAPALASPGKAAQALSWSFQKDADGWHYDGKWAYKGKPVVEHTKEVGDGALAARVDFTPTKDKDWSEIKLGQAAVTEEKPLDMGQNNRIAFDFYYQPSAMTTGAFKTKIYMKTQDQKEVQAIADIDIKHATADKNGYQKVHVLVPFDTPEKPVIFFEVNLVDLAKGTQPQLVVLPFSKFVGKNGGTFHPERLQHFAIYCNTNGDEAVDSHFYLDDIHAVKQ